MQVTLIQTRKVLDIERRLEDGSTERIGSYEISIADPSFVAQAEELVADIQARGLADPGYDYADLAGKARSLLDRSIVGGVDAVTAILGAEPDFYNSLLLLTAIMQQVNELDPGRRMVEGLNALVPEAAQLSREMLASNAIAQKKKKRPRGKPGK